MKRSNHSSIQKRLLTAGLISIAAALMIGIVGLVSVFELNKTITHSEQFIVRPLGILVRMYDNFIEARNNVVDYTFIPSEALKADLSSNFEASAADIEQNINEYETILKDLNLTDTEEYDMLMQLGDYIDEWVSSVEQCFAEIDLDPAKAIDTYSNNVRVNGTTVRDQLKAIMALNELHAEENNLFAHRRSVSVTVILLVMFLLNALISFIAAYRLSRSINQPIRHIVESAKLLASGDMSTRADGGRLTEIQHLADAFNAVSANIISLLSDAEHILDAARYGKLDVGTGANDYTGKYQVIMRDVMLTVKTIRDHLDAMPHAIGFFNFDGHLLYGNKTLMSDLGQYGYDRDDTQLLPYILSSRRSRAFSDEVLRFIRRQSGDVFVFTIYASPIEGDKRQRVYRMSLKCVFGVANEANSSGDRMEYEATCLMLTVTDITDLTYAVNDAEAASKAKSDFLSAMGHELRTPLNAISGMAQVIRNESASEKTIECVDQIETASLQLLHIINDVLELSALSSGDIALDESAFSVDGELGGVIENMSAQAAEKDIRIVYESSISEEVVSDPLKLKQILRNLLSNAVKFSDGGTITVSAEERERAEDTVVLAFSVTDMGIGMSEDTVAGLFTPFRQKEGGLSRQYGGIGAGLVIAKGLAEAMGGGISASSQLGKGSCFTFWIKATLCAPEPAETTAMDLSTLCALVVDDVEINRIIAAELLDSFGITVEQAENGREAVDMFTASEAGYYDIILMDLQMPVLDGFGATTCIRALDRRDAKSVRIIALTSNSEKEHVETSVQCGMNGFISKPIDLSVLLDELQKTPLEV